MKLSLLIFSIPAILLCSSCHQGQVQEKTSGPDTEVRADGETGLITISRGQFESMSMKVGDPVLMMFRDRISANGYVEASPTGHARISTFISGRVRQIYFSAGEFVNKGQTVFTLESPELILLQQNYAEAFQYLKLLKADYERLQVLWDEKVAAEKDLLKAESEYLSGYIEVEGLRARLLMMHIDPARIEKGEIVPYLSVKSPVAGNITSQKLVLGQHLIPLETVMEVINADELRLRLELFEISMSDLKVGQEVTFSAPDQPGRIFTATLSQIGKSVSPESKTVDCYASIRGDKSVFVNNMFVESYIITSEREAKAIPEEAVIREPDGDYVLVLTEEKEDQMTFKKVQVLTGITRQGETEILDQNVTSILLEGVYDLWSGG